MLIVVYESYGIIILCVCLGILRFYKKKITHFNKFYKQYPQKDDIYAKDILCYDD